MTELKTKIRQGGRLVIPAAYRKALGLKPGDEVVLVLEEGEIRVVEIGAISLNPDSVLGTTLRVLEMEKAGK